MTLGTTQEVTDICGSTDSSFIERQLVIARAHLDTMLAKEGLTAPTTNVLLSHAVSLMASAFISSKPGAVDPRTNYTVDGFSRKDKPASQIDEYMDQAKVIIADYVAANITESQIPAIMVVGRRGRRVGEYEEMTEAEEDEY
jgi:hypothetical protein